MALQQQADYLAKTGRVVGEAFGISCWLTGWLVGCICESACLASFWLGNSSSSSSNSAWRPGHSFAAHNILRRFGSECCNVGNVGRRKQCNTGCYVRVKGK